MSKIIAAAAIRGAHEIVSEARKKWQQAMDKHGSGAEVGFPETAYYLPIIYGLSGLPVRKLADMEKVFAICERLLPEPV